MEQRAAMPALVCYKEDGPAGIAWPITEEQAMTILAKFESRVIPKLSKIETGTRRPVSTDYVEFDRFAVRLERELGKYDAGDHLLLETPTLKEIEDLFLS